MAWHTAQDLAGLPGLPTSAYRVTERAKREDWLSRPREKGKGREYHASSLPEATRKHLAARAAAKAATQTAPPPAPTSAPARVPVAVLGGAARARAEARAAVLAAAEAFVARAGLPVSHALTDFAARYNAGEVPVNGHRAHVSRITVQTIYRWRKEIKGSGAAALAGRYGNRRGTGQVDRQPALCEFLTGMIAEHPHLGAGQLRAAALARFGGQPDVTVPPLSTLRYWEAAWREENAGLMRAVTNPDGWKNKDMVAFGDRSEDVTALNGLWEFDSTPADVMLADGRHSIIGVIDVYSRRARLLVSRTSKAAAVAGLLRQAIIAWGVPEAAKTDNGSDYVSHHMTGALAALGIEQRLCTPFCAWEKPHIERFFKTFSHSIVEMLTGYIGHSVAERQAIEARRAFSERLFAKDRVVEVAMTAAQLQAVCDRWVEAVYHQDGHGGLSGATPAAQAASWRGTVRRIGDLRLLDVLLAEAPGDGLRVVTKKGIRVDRMGYIHAELGLWVGRQVKCLYDPDDVGRLYVFGAETGEFVCVAECPEVTGVSRQAIAIAARRKQAEAVQEARRALKATAKKQGVKDIALEILGHREQAPGRVLPFPQPAAAHDSEGIRGAQALLKAQELPARTVDMEAARRALAQRMAEDRAQPPKKEERPADRYRRWCGLNARVAGGEALTEEEARFWRGYRATAEHDAEECLAQDFGLAR